MASMVCQGKGSIERVVQSILEQSVTLREDLWTASLHRRRPQSGQLLQPPEIVEWHQTLVSLCLSGLPPHRPGTCAN